MAQKTELFVVAVEGTIEGTGKLTSSEIYDIYSSGMFVVVFRKTNTGIEYADIDQQSHEIIWKKAETED